VSDALRVRVAYLVLVLALTGGCKQHPQQQPKVSDAELQRLRTQVPGMTDECLAKLKWGGVEALPRRSDRCFTFEAPRLWKGYWLNALEDSQFCLSLSACPGNSDAMWLEFATEPSFHDKLGQGGAYEIEFVGRRSNRAGLFGHFGMFRKDMIVDRIITMKEVAPPPQPPTKAEIKAREKECEVSPNCFTNNELGALGWNKE
jgi:hypothetical protein